MKTLIITVQKGNITEDYIILAKDGISVTSIYVEPRRFIRATEANSGKDILINLDFIITVEEGGIVNTSQGNEVA